MRNQMEVTTLGILPAKSSVIYLTRIYRGALSAARRIIGIEAAEAACNTYSALLRARGAVKVVSGLDRRI